MVTEDLMDRIDAALEIPLNLGIVSGVSVALLVMSAVATLFTLIAGIVYSAWWLVGTFVFGILCGCLGGVVKWLNDEYWPL